MFVSQQLMVCSLLQTYTKLRQLPRLFSELLSVICQPALDELRPLLLSAGVDVIPDQCTILKTELCTAGFSQGTRRMMFEKSIILTYLNSSIFKRVLENSIEWSDIVRRFYFISNQSECHLLKAQSKYDAIFYTL